MENDKKELFSYSRIDMYDKCPFKYKLKYIENRVINDSSIATEFGTLIHAVEEKIGNYIKEHTDIDYNALLLFLDNGDDEILGCNELKNKYKDIWDNHDYSEYSYEDKYNMYKNKGIYRLENYIKNHEHDIEMYGTEVPFEIEINGTNFHGFIDRIMHDTDSDEYIIEDIKTYSKKIKDCDLPYELQMFVYKQAIGKIIGNDKKIKCAYDLVLLDERQECVLNEDKINYRLNATLKKINNNEFAPKPTPLCYWCCYSETNPNITKEGRGLCPYFLKWTKENKIYSSYYKWCGESCHKRILEEFKKSIDK